MIVSSLSLPPAHSDLNISKKWNLGEMSQNDTKNEIDISWKKIPKGNYLVYTDFFNPLILAFDTHFILVLLFHF